MTYVKLPEFVAAFHASVTLCGVFEATRRFVGPLSGPPLELEPGAADDAANSIATSATAATVVCRARGREVMPASDRYGAGRRLPLTTVRSYGDGARLDCRSCISLDISTACSGDVD